MTQTIRRRATTDFYSVRQLTFKGPDGVWHPDLEAIESIASSYQ